jgi:hypothetical protein
MIIKIISYEECCAALRLLRFRGLPGNLVKLIFMPIRAINRTIFSRIGNRMLALEYGYAS